MKVSLEQWEAFVAVVEEGSFAKAAEVLNKSQSSVSYILTQMEQRLPAPVLKQVGRKAELTEAGKALFRQAKNLLKHASDIERLAGYMASGWEAEITLAIDAIFPITPLYCALQKFSEVSPTTRIRVLETTLSGTEEALLLRQADMVLTGRVPPGFLGQQVGIAEMIAVASPEHPLIQLGRSVSEEELKAERQIVLRDTGIKREQDAGWLGSEQRWTVSHFSTSIEIVKYGLGFAFLPEAKIREELASGHLVRIPMETLHKREIPLHLVLTGQNCVGPGAKALADLIYADYAR